jgi:hypothetical protein
MDAQAMDDELILSSARAKTSDRFDDPRGILDVDTVLLHLV